MKEIIINSANDKTTIAVVENNELIEKYEKNDETERLEGNIYIGKVKDILPGMQVAFVDIGDERNAFLHIKDIIPRASNETGNKEEDLSKYNIKDYVKVGMPVIVEVKKDKNDKKGAKVSTSLNLAGKFIALIPDNKFVTVSQKIENKQREEELKQIVRDALAQMNIDQYGIILRTSAIDASKEQIIQDMREVIQKYNDVVKKAEKVSKEPNFKPQLLHSKGDIINKLLIDLGNQDLSKVIVNNKDIYSNVVSIIEKNCLKVETELIERENILDIYSLESQIEKISNRKVWLKCGGFISIDKTEALTAIDVNTGKYTGKGSIDETVLKVNLEASVEIAKQIRVRDIGGIIVIDYIDMNKKEDELAVQRLLEESLKKDRSKTQVVGFTGLHLLEMTRKRMG